MFDCVEAKDISLVKWIKISSIRTRAESFQLSVLGHLKAQNARICVAFGALGCRSWGRGTGQGVLVLLLLTSAVVP